MAPGEDAHVAQSAAILQMALVQNQSYQISLTGHAQPATFTPRARSEHTARRRAEHVKTQLENHNIPDDRITVKPPVLTAEFGPGRNRFARAEVTEG